MFSVHHAILTDCAVTVVARCLSVCPSHAGIVSTLSTIFRQYLADKHNDIASQMIAHLCLGL